MKVIWNLLSYTLIYKVCACVMELWRYCRIYNMTSTVFYSEAFTGLIHKYLNVELKKDWIGRLYGVFNPMLDVNGHFDINNMIFEVDGDRTNTDDYVKTWIYKQLGMLSGLFSMDRLYGYISMDLKHVGPVSQDNWLVVFDLTQRRVMAKAFRKAMLQASVYTILALVAYFIFF